MTNNMINNVSSYNNLIESVKKASVTTLPRVLFGLGIAGIGVANAKVLAKAFDNDMEKIRQKIDMSGRVPK